MNYDRASTRYDLSKDRPEAIHRSHCTTTMIQGLLNSAVTQKRRQQRTGLRQDSVTFM